MKKDRKAVQVGGMSESPYGRKTVETIKREGLGNYTTLFVGPWTPDKLRDVCEFCRHEGMRFVMDEMINRLTGEFTADYARIRKDVLEVLGDYQDVFDGFLLMCEYGGLMFYWPFSTVEGSKTLPTPAADFEEAARNTEGQMESVLAYAREHGLHSPFVCIEACGQAAPFLYRAGIDRVDLEVLYTHELERGYSAVKGAAMAYGKGNFGVDMAMVWYGGNQHDELWGKRWRTSLLHAFLRGADPIYAEHGLMNYQALGKNYGTDHPEVKRFRTILREANDFISAHPRPVGFPQAAVAIVCGRLDGYTGAGQTHLWGQRENEAFRLGDPDRSWELFEGLYHRRSWENRNCYGDSDYSGNPPLGQVDIIPHDAPQKLFNRYRILIFLGRNSMDSMLYEKLVDYVEQGGQLLMAAAHMNMSCKPGEKEYLAYADGDWRKLFGVRLLPAPFAKLSYGIKFKQEPSCHWRLPLWSPNCDPKFSDGGFLMGNMDVLDADVLAVASDRTVDRVWSNCQQGVLYAKKHGRGCAILLNSLEYPGANGVSKLYGFLMASACESVKDFPRVECSDRVRFALYGDAEDRTGYFLNTEVHLEQPVIIQVTEEKQLRITLAPGEIREIALGI